MIGSPSDSDGANAEGPRKPEAIDHELPDSATAPEGVGAPNGVGASSPLVPGGGLAAHEAAGGHTIARHIGQTDADLAARLAAEPGISGASSFTNRAVAESALSDTLAAKQADITAWLSGTNPRLTLNNTLPDSVGRSLARGAAGPVDASGVRVVLQRDTSLPTGYRIVTGFPQ
jgi:filamentous hemagglutinin